MLTNQWNHANIRETWLWLHGDGSLVIGNWVIFEHWPKHWTVLKSTIFLCSTIIVGEILKFLIFSRFCDLVKGRLISVSCIYILHFSVCAPLSADVYCSNLSNLIQEVLFLFVSASAPSIVSHFESQLTQSGPTISLPCSATGIPLPTIQWNQDEEPLPADDRYSVVNSVDPGGQVTSVLTISQVQVLDGGSFRCRANNGVGEDVFQGRLDVYGMCRNLTIANQSIHLMYKSVKILNSGDIGIKWHIWCLVLRPGIPRIRQMANVTSVANSDVVLKCHVVGFPVHQVTWSKGRDTSQHFIQFANFSFWTIKNCKIVEIKRWMIVL